MLGKTSRRSSLSRRSYSTCCSSLILLLAIFPGCPKPPPVEPIPPAAVCRQWNREQLIGFYVLSQLAIEEQARGDEAHVAAAVAELGSLLTRCGILKRPEGGSHAVDR